METDLSKLLNKLPKPGDGLRIMQEAFKRNELIAKNIFPTEAERILSVPVIGRNVHAPSQKEVNNYQSAGVLVEKLASTYNKWREELSPDSQPVIVAILQGGVRVNISTITAESFHGLCIEGTSDEGKCLILTHQTSVQLLCYVEKVEDESSRRSIGFNASGYN